MALADALDGPRVITGFLDAARAAGTVIASPAVRDRWDQPSALARMTVGAVAGHLFLVVRRVDQHLDEPEPPDKPTLSPRTFAWPRVERSDDLDREQHRTVRDDGEHVARWGWPDVASAYAERVETLTERLADPPRRAVALGEHVMDLDTYLATRIVELLVHADDLAVSVGLEPAEPPRDAATIALGVLVEAGRTLHGDLALLRAFTRRERVPPSPPTVF